MTKLIRRVACVAFAAIAGSLFAYNGGYENSSLTNITIGGVTYKGYGNNTVTKRTESGTTIAANAYAQCSKLTSVSLANVTSIGDASFAYSALTSVELPATLKSIGYIPFGGCKNLASVTINSTAFMTSADEAKEPFRDCTALKTVTAKCAPPSWDFKKVFPSVTTVKVPQANLTAWQAKKYAGVTVEDLSSFAIFDGNGGTVSGKASVKSPLTAGTMFGKQPTAVLSGKVFVGWFTAKAGGKQVNCSSIVPEGTTTYYAHYEDRLSLGKAFVGSNISAGWESNGWCGQATVTHDGVAAARSGYITNNGRSYLQTTVTGEGTLTFWWKTSCESASNDALRFLVDGTEKKTLSGERDWAQATIIIHGSGVHTIKWNYTKNATVSKGEDYAWLDQVVWTPAGTKVTYDANGGTVSGKATITTELNPGDLFGKLPTAAKDGQVLVGWFTAKTGGQKVNCSSIVPNGAVTYYAQYESRLSLGKAFVGSNISASWESNGWCGQATVTHDGVAAARSGYITNNGRSYLQTTVTGEGTLTFWWKTSCESASNDALRFLVDGTEKKVLSGERDWAQATIIIHGSGTHTIKWNYTKNATVSKGEDYAWLDQVVWTPVSKAQSLSVSPDIGGAETLQSSGTSLSAMPDSVIRRGVLADGTGVYSLILDAADDMTGVIYIEFSDGSTLVEDCWLLENGVPMRVMTESMLVFEL